MTWLVESQKIQIKELDYVGVFRHTSGFFHRVSMNLIAYCNFRCDPQSLFQFTSTNGKSKLSIESYNFKVP